MKYVIQDRETGNIIDTFSTYEEAEEMLHIFENEDRADDCYTPNLYEIIEK